MQSLLWQDKNKPETDKDTPGVIRCPCRFLRKNNCIHHTHDGHFSSRTYLKPTHTFVKGITCKCVHVCVCPHKT